jgi:hypothetical protein
VAQGRRTKEQPMKPPLKLNSIDQEHLQELYNAAGVARDELPYTEAFESIWQGFQDRTFKNAARDQIFGALLKYTRCGTNSSSRQPATLVLTEEQRVQLKSLLPRHAAGGKLLPYSDEFEAAMKEFNKHAKLSLSTHEFWTAMLAGQSARRRPPVRRAAVKVAVVEAQDDEDGE